MQVFASPETIQSMTPLNPFDRLPDGRPGVPDALLERISKAATEQVWRTLGLHGYTHQFEAAGSSRTPGGCWWGGR
jgi:4-hydroxy-4-methyl-2-oxoglutarate aldolase